MESRSKCKQPNEMDAYAKKSSSMKQKLWLLGEQLKFIVFMCMNWTRIHFISVFIVLADENASWVLFLQNGTLFQEMTLHI